MPSVRSVRSARRLLPVILGGLLLVDGLSARQAPVGSPANVAGLNPLLVTQDFDNDGAPDRLCVDQSTVTIALSRGDSPVSRLGHPTSVVGFVAIDVDRDGDADVLTLTAAGSIWLWRNDGRGRFTAERVVPDRSLAHSMTDSVGQTTTREDAAPGDGSDRGYRPAGWTTLGAVAPVCRGVRARTRTALAAPLNPHSSPASPRAPPSSFTTA